jgi:DNA adenine methylase
MRVRAIVPYYGSKRTLAPRIVEALGEHKSYYEPLCGSLAVLLNKPMVAQETVADLYGDVCNLAGVLQSDALCGLLYGRLERLVMTDELVGMAHRNLAERPWGVAKDGFNVDRAYWFFVEAWCGRNGLCGLGEKHPAIAVRWCQGGGAPVVRMFGAIESIPAWHQRLRNVLVLQRDVFHLLPRIKDEEGTAIYLDPPYPLSARGGHDRYVHDFSGGDVSLFTDKQSDDHVALSVEAKRFTKARVVVSTYANSLYDLLYDGWRKIDCAMTKNLANQNKSNPGTPRTKGVAPEVLYVNG